MTESKRKPRQYLVVATPLYDRVKRIAKAEGRTIQAQADRLLAQAVAAYETEAKTRDGAEK